MLRAFGRVSARGGASEEGAARESFCIGKGALPQAAAGQHRIAIQLNSKLFAVVARKTFVGRVLVPVLFRQSCFATDISRYESPLVTLRISLRNNFRHLVMAQINKECGLTLSFSLSESF